MKIEMDEYERIIVTFKEGGYQASQNLDTYLMYAILKQLEFISTRIMNLESAIMRRKNNQ